MAGIGGLSLGFLIVQLNAYSLVHHGAEFLKYFLKNLEQAPDAVCIQETCFM